jgi:phosphatidylserine decarboxylase
VDDEVARHALSRRWRAARRWRALMLRIAQQENINFLLTNRIPRRWLTLFMGWVSRIENPLICGAGMALWRLFADLELQDAKHTRFRSLHECFTRELKDGARAIERDPAVLASPCDAVVGACGRVEDGLVLQAKGFPYPLLELLGDRATAAYYSGGSYATLRLTAGMYHRFHAPHDCRVERVTYFSGDTWNVNPIALKRIERLFCKNERAVITCRLGSGQLVTLVPVAAILVASIRLHWLDVRLHLRYRGQNVIPCDTALEKGEEMGWFEHGSTVIVLTPPGFVFADAVREGQRVRMGQALFRAAPGQPTSGTQA